MGVMTLYLVSACLCGVNCKYSGKNNRNEDCVKLLRDGKAILICPEQLGGLTTPRLPAEIFGDSEGIVEFNKGQVITSSGVDVTSEFIKGAEESLKIAKEAGVIRAILKEGSPSCGVNFIYDGTFNGVKIKGEGITSFILKKNGFEVISDEEFSKVII